MLQIGGKFVKAKAFLGCGTTAVPAFRQFLSANFLYQPCQIYFFQGAEMHPTGVE
jgi:hypothetical protein